MANRLSDERLQRIINYSGATSTEDEDMARELLALRQEVAELRDQKIDAVAWNIAQGQIAELQHRLSAGPVMPETPSAEVAAAIEAASVWATSVSIYAVLRAALAEEQGLR